MFGKNYIDKFLHKHAIESDTLIKEALTHKSASPSGHYEKLEFLGDSVLGLVISGLLFEAINDREVGSLSRLKSYLVSKEALYKIGKENGIIKQAVLGSTLSMKEASLNKKIVSDVVESITGAVYLRLGYEPAKDFVLGLYKKEIKALKRKKDLGDYKSELQIKIQANGIQLPEYRMIKTTGEEHKKVFHIGVYINGKMHGTGRGRTIKEAEQEAAKRAVKKIKTK